jgi:hypothetical protein
MHIRKRYSFQSVHIHIRNTFDECVLKNMKHAYKFLYVSVFAKDWKCTYANIHTWNKYINLTGAYDVQPCKSVFSISIFICIHVYAFIHTLMHSRRKEKKIEISSIHIFIEMFMTKLRAYVSHIRPVNIYI